MEHHWKNHLAESPRGQMFFFSMMFHDKILLYIELINELRYCSIDFIYLHYYCMKTRRTPKVPHKTSLFIEKNYRYWSNWTCQYFLQMFSNIYWTCHHFCERPLTFIAQQVSLKACLSKSNFAFQINRKEYNNCPPQNKAKCLESFPVFDQTILPIKIMAAKDSIPLPQRQKFNK